MASTRRQALPLASHWLKFAVFDSAASTRQEGPGNFQRSAWQPPPSSEWTPGFYRMARYAPALEPASTAPGRAITNSTGGATPHPPQPPHQKLCPTWRFPVRGVSRFRPPPIDFAGLKALAHTRSAGSAAQPFETPSPLRLASRRRLLIGLAARSAMAPAGYGRATWQGWPSSPVDGVELPGQQNRRKK